MDQSFGVPGAKLKKLVLITNIKISPEVIPFGDSADLINFLIQDFTDQVFADFAIKWAKWTQTRVAMVCREN